MNKGLLRGLSSPVIPGLVKISSVVVSGGPITEIRFQGIPGHFSSLQLRVIGRSTVAAQQGDLQIRFNGDAAANYDQELIIAQGAGIAGAQSINAVACTGGAMTGGTSPAGHASSVVTDIIGYASTEFFKTTISRNLFPKTTGASGTLNLYYSSHWRSKAPITEIGLSLTAGNWEVGSVADLYGVS